MNDFYQLLQTSSRLAAVLLEQLPQKAQQDEASAGALSAASAARREDVPPTGQAEMAGRVQGEMAREPAYGAYVPMAEPGPVPGLPAQDAGKTLGPEALSRIYERDARRYG